MSDNLFGKDITKNPASRANRRKALEVLRAALEAVDPARAVRRYIKRDGDLLRIGAQTYHLDEFRRVLVIGGGKASGTMASAVEEILGDRITAGWVNVKDGYTAAASRIHLHEAGHPLPDDRGVEGAQRIADLLADAGADDLVLCLISGGGSSLMTLPVQGISLDDMQALTTTLLHCGATINEINAVRKHLSQIKGGNLARLARPATLVSLMVSDVVGSPLDVIASGPTVPDPSTFAQACGVLSKYDIWAQVPTSIERRLKAGAKGDIPETPKEGDVAFDKAQNLIIADNSLAAEAAIAQAGGLGFSTLLLSTYVEGEAREVAKVVTAIAKEICHVGRPLRRPACVVLGGETTVTVRGDGMGGRNQELALAAAIGLDGLDDVMIFGLATDGTDGPTDAAGAIADGGTMTRASEMGLDAASFLSNNDAYHFFQALSDLLLTGPTGTNVNDLTFVFAF